MQRNKKEVRAAMKKMSGGKAVGDIPVPVELWR